MSLHPPPLRKSVCKHLLQHGVALQEAVVGLVLCAHLALPAE